MKKSLFLFILPGILFSQALIAQFKVDLQEKHVTLPTYLVAPAENSPIFFRGEAYQGASRHYYPLKMNDQYINERVEKEWVHLILENEYIQLAVTPEIGGKLYYATDKTNGYHFVYKNNVVKPSNIGMTGAWVSGGIEWCVLHHHRPSTYLPVNYTATENDDGSKTIWVGEYEPRHGMRWTIGITAFPGKSYFKTEGRIFNASPVTHSFLFWANVAAHTNQNYQAIFPPSARVATFHSKTDFTRWPFSHEIYRGADFTKGVDISWWKNVEASNSFFVHDLKEDFMGGYDHGKNAGTVHVADHNIVKGAKLWEWGSGPRGQATEGRLTENDGPYVEIMVGAFSDNQPDYSWIRPYEIKKWEQFWYPVRGIGGFKNACLNGAVNLEERAGNSVFLGYYSTGKVEKANVVLKKGGTVVWEKMIEISPEKPFAETIKLNGPFNLTDLGTELTDLGTGEKLISYYPALPGEIKNLPEPWKGYPAPEKLETIEELYLTGKRVEQFYAPRDNEMDWYREALKRDPGDIRTNTAVGNHYLKRGDYLAARDYLGRAIKRLTHDYTRPSACEPLYLQGLTLKALGLYDEAIDTLYRASWDYAWHSAAFYQLAQISAMRSDYPKALLQVNESLSTNSVNNRAVALKASLQRRTGDPEGANITLKGIALTDPLDFRVKNEYYLLAKESGDHQKADILLASLKKEMRNFDENYLDVAVGYINDGLLAEAEDILQRFSGSNPLFDYYLGFIHDKQGNLIGAKEHFLSAARQPVESVFPHRLETVEVLKTALKNNPADGKAYYYTGNILYDKQPEQAIASWEKAAALNPDLALAFRNLGWGYYRHYSDVQKAITYYEKAIALNRNEAIYFTELDELYALANTPIEIRMKLFEGQNEVVKQRDDAFIRQLEVLTLAGQPDKAVEYLNGVEFAYREGSSRVREIMIDAQLMLGRKYLGQKDYEKALHYFLEAQVPDEEAGSTRSGNRDIQVNYHIALAYEALGKTSEATSFFNKVIQHEPGRMTLMDYYRGMALMKTGDASRAKTVFESMVAEADRQLRSSGTSEAGIIFGEREAENTLHSRIYTMKGLGNKGLGKLKQANEYLEKAVQLSHSNLWAKAELNEMVK
jgi:tetratricopeptide (TPR) repeat protein